MTDVTLPAADLVLKDGNIPNKPDKTNWVEEAGGLPPYIRRVAEDLHSERGMTVSHAIAAAINKIKQWARGGGDTKADTKAQAAAALAQWERMKVSKAVSPDTDDLRFAQILVAESEEAIAKGLNYMEKPHRFTPGPAGMCLFCSNSQRWHTENRPKTPAEVEQEKKDRAIQEKNDDALGSALMLTPLPTEDDVLQQQIAEQKKLDLAGKVAGAPVQDPNDPLTAAGPITDPRAKAALKKALAEVLAKKMAQDSGGGGKGKAAGADAPLVNVQYDPDKKTGGISEVERKQLVDDGIAMEDGTFPIRDQNDLKVALKFWGKATDPHAARDHIIARAYDLDLLDLLPQNLKDYDESRSATDTDDDADKEGEERPDPTSRPSSASSAPVSKHGTKGAPGYELLHPHRVSSKDGPRTRAAKIRALTRLLASWAATEDHTDVSSRYVTGATSTGRGPQPGERSARVAKTAAYAITKSADEKRYTLGPMYIPDRLDAHNEFTTADELQKAVWDYVRAGNRDIRLQHNLDIVAGECVEVLSWPTEITTTLALPGSGLRKAAPVTLPAGTTYMGIIWEPWAWEWVKKGKISGLSMGGAARRVAVEFDSSVTKAIETQVEKFNPGQPRDAHGRWTHTPGAASSLTPTSLPHLRGIVEGKRRPGEAFIRHSPTHLEHVGEASAFTETDGPSALSALAQALLRTAQNTGVDLDHLLTALASKLSVKKHGHKGEPGYGLLHPGKNGVNLKYDEDHFTDEELDEAARRLGRQKIGDKEYGLHVAGVQKRLDEHGEKGGSKNPLESKNSTHLLHRVDPNDPTSAYTPERKRQHREIISAIISDAIQRGVPKERKSWIAGGLPGAGKSSFIKDEQGQKLLGLVPEDETSTGLAGFKNAIVLNPDDIKTLMAARGMFPDIPGTDPMERVGFVHEESSEITQSLAEAATSMGFNVVWDITAHSSTSVADRIADLRSKGYNDTTYFLLDVTLEHSIKSAAARHRLGLDRRRSGKSGKELEATAAFGGRYVPEFVTKTNASKHGNRSKMRDAFDEIIAGSAKTKSGQPIGLPYRAILVDNEGYAKKVLADHVFSASISGSSGRR